MLTLAFKIGADQYALPSTEIEEAIALVNLHELPDAPPGIVGEFNYHGRMVPAIDLSELILTRPSHRRWSTRILLTRLTKGGSAGKLVGLIAENATELIETDRAVEMNRSPRLLHLHDHLDQAAIEFLSALETEPPADWQPAAEEPDLGMPPSDLTLVVTDNDHQPPPEPAMSPPPIRHRRAPRFSYFDQP